VLLSVNKMKLSWRGGEQVRINAQQIEIHQQEFPVANLTRASYIRYIHNDSPATVDSLPTFPVWRQFEGAEFSKGINAMEACWRFPVQSCKK